ncbi:hypothetical protein GJ629_08075 [Halapricum sp. CBA1109]|uniref:hypothetical protein n=1 Tax=Halapricum sp. CBA1109 TaxID=2668068 RepID=UPI0012FB4500|nr:hypothetical protein [Halapricum sp. CBA1109]MUV89857.1 hypothetical protein [Halapricum sp. CBA1109]
MSDILPDDGQQFALGLGAGVLALVLGVAFVAVAALSEVALLDSLAVAVALLVVAFVFAVAGLYDIVARGTTRRGVSDLIASAGVVLALLAPYGDPAQAFVAAGAVALLTSGAYHAALAAELMHIDEDPAVDVESEETP